MSTSTDISSGSPSSDQPPVAATSPDVAPAADHAVGAQAERGGIAARPVIAVALLTAHPGNVRRNLALSAEFVASVEANGVLVPLRITRDPGAATG